MKMLGVQTDREIFRAQPEEKAARIQACEENKGALDYHQTNSFELDDDFVEVIQTLWSKGYDLSLIHISADNMEGLLEQRHHNKKLLRAGKHLKGPAKRTKEQDEAFGKTLERMLKTE